jgi:AcrR family transcriptional regulator
MVARTLAIVNRAVYDDRMSPPASPAGASRREQILAAAADLFARHGFHGVSIDEIGAAVGISGPALYRHFPGKDAILAAMLVGISEHLLTGGQERVAAVRVQETGDGAALAALVDWHVAFALDHPALITVQQRDLDALSAADRETVRRLQRSYVDVWAREIQTARTGGDGRPTAVAAAHAVLGLINSTPHSARLGRARTGDLLRRMALRALLAPDPA